MNIDKIILKCIWKSKGIREIRRILKKNNKIGKMILFNIKILQKGTVIEIVILIERQIYKRIQIRFI